MNEHPETDVCCLCAGPDFFTAVERGEVQGAVAHMRWDYAFCPFAEEDDDHFG